LVVYGLETITNEESMTNVVLSPMESFTLGVPHYTIYKIIVSGDILKELYKLSTQKWEETKDD
jgi:hypothetical protein